MRRSTWWKALEVVETVGAIAALAVIGTAWACGVAAYRAADRVINPGKR